MADGGVALDDRWQVCRNVKDDVVLHVRALADLDRGLIAAQNRAKPDARVGANLNVSYEDGSWCDECVGMHLWSLAGELELQGSL